MRYHSYLNSAKKIIAAYDGGTPLSAFLKVFFSANKKYGSKDRKQIAALCYDFYRLGKSMPDAAVEERIIAAVFLCEQSANAFLQFHKPEWNELITRPLVEKITLAGIDAKDIFPWADELGAGIGHHLFCTSFLLQPGLFLRSRPGKKDIVLNKLKDAGLPFEIPAGDCIALANSTKLDGVIVLDQEAVVQDLNSQRVLDFLKQAQPMTSFSCWDCCAASGGKSILAYDLLDKKPVLTVSDIRESIIANLKKRFSVAGIKKYHSFIADLSAGSHSIPNEQYAIIICDAPCTGSGTWARTPEQLYQFKTEMINAYTEKQKKIVSHAIPHLQKEGLFFYITCSVFKKENEMMVDFIKEKFHLQVVQMESLKGFDKKADSMFVAVFKKP